ncbi:hypothetical protein CPC08DRAFT_527378 [Agrocybe pediades]|nr:hypothetical protein CPC08DRAFT_527378 [Agrocybe pediades]
MVSFVLLGYALLPPKFGDTFLPSAPIMTSKGDFLKRACGSYSYSDSSCLEILPTTLIVLQPLAQTLPYEPQPHRVCEGNEKEYTFLAACTSRCSRGT